MLNSRIKIYLLHARVPLGYSNVLVDTELLSIVFMEYSLVVDCYLYFYLHSKFVSVKNIRIHNYQNNQFGNDKKISNKD